MKSPLRNLLLSLALSTLGGLPSPAAEPVSYPTVGSIERLDPRFDQLVPADAKIEKLAEGFIWSEGPVWIRHGAYLLFSDIPRNSVMKWQQGPGLSLFMKPSGYTDSKLREGESGSNGLLVDPQGRLVLCQHGDRRVVRVEKDGRWTTLADRYQGKRLNSPNDATFRSNGDLYFTDPPYGLAKKAVRELDFCGLYRVSAAGHISLLARDLTAPNGIAFSPDEKTLYVANSDPKHAVWMAYDVLPDGGIGRGRVFYDATAQLKTMKGLPDGLKLDRAGNLFATGPGGVNVFTPGGKLLGRIRTGQATANCCFGDDGSTLYMTAHMFICRVRTSTKGQGY